MQVKRALGHATIDDNEVLFAEASALADILGDVQLTTKSLLARQQLCNNPQRRMVCRLHTCSQLLEALHMHFCTLEAGRITCYSGAKRGPTMRIGCVQVEAEISILLDRLRGVATAAAFSGSAAKERDPESVLPKAGPKDKAIYDYVIASSASQVGARRITWYLLWRTPAAASWIA